MRLPGCRKVCPRRFIRLLSPSLHGCASCMSQGRRRMSSPGLYSPYAVEHTKAHRVLPDVPELAPVRCQYLRLECTSVRIVRLRAAMLRQDNRVCAACYIGSRAPVKLISRMVYNRKHMATSRVRLEPAHAIEKRVIYFFSFCPLSKGDGSSRAAPAACLLRPACPRTRL